jgi:uncharacterized membrane protein YedE/YeeE
MNENIAVNLLLSTLLVVFLIIVYREKQPFQKFFEALRKYNILIYVASMFMLTIILWCALDVWITNIRDFLAVAKFNLVGTLIGAVFLGPGIYTAIIATRRYRPLKSKGLTNPLVPPILIFSGLIIALVSYTIK